MTVNDDLIEEYLNRIKETYTVYDLIEILGMDIDQFLEITWDLLLENQQLQLELGIQSEA